MLQRRVRLPARVRYVAEGNCAVTGVTGRSYCDYVTFNPIAVIGIEILAEHLLNGIETVND